MNYIIQLELAGIGAVLKERNWLVMKWSFYMLKILWNKETWEKDQELN